MFEANLEFNGIPDEEELLMLGELEHYIPDELFYREIDDYSLQMIRTSGGYDVELWTDEDDNKRKVTGGQYPDVDVAICHFFKYIYLINADEENLMKLLFKQMGININDGS